MTEVLFQSYIEQNDHPFWRRTHEDTRLLVEVIQSEPEYPLTDDEKERVISFENQLFEGTVEGVEPSRSLAEYTSLIDASFSVSPEYLETQEGAELLLSAFPALESELADTDISEVLNAIPFSELQRQEAAIKTMQGRSQQYTEALYVEMAKDNIPERELETVSFELKSQETIDNFTLLKEYKGYLREVRRELESEMENESSTYETAAKYMITDIYRDKINAMLAGLYPSMLTLYRQAEAKGDQDIQEQLERISPLARIAKATMDSESSKSQFVRLLDYVRNGATYNEEGGLTPLDDNLFEILHEVNERPQESAQPIFGEEEIEQLRQRGMDADEMRDFMETYLQQLGLSEYGWQVEIREDKRSFAVSGVEKKIKIPATFKRGVIKGGGGSGVAALVEHEIGGKYPGHVMQSVNAENNKAGLRLGREPLFRGKKYVANREAGGVLAEMGTLGLLFDEQRPMKGGYAAAMGALIDDGSRVDAIRAFAESVATDPAQVSDAHYKLAANRVSRLFRYGGWNSQPLDYVEAAGFIQTTKDLDETTLNTMLAEAVFAPRDMMRLHSYNMLPRDSEYLFQPDNDPTETIVGLLRALLEKNE